MSQTYKPVLDTTDLLRASIVLSISAFDYLIHELFRIEVLRRHEERRPIARLEIPFNVHAADDESRGALLEKFIVERNSFRSFVDPVKYADAMGCFFQSPWDKVGAQLGKGSEELKARLKLIYRWRNRIAHEADINPSLAGIELWPILKSDVLDAVWDLEQIGLATVAVVRAH